MFFDSFKKFENFKYKIKLNFLQFFKRSAIYNLDHGSQKNLKSQRPNSANILHRLLPDAVHTQIPSVVFAFANVVLGILDNWTVGGEPLLERVIGFEDFSLDVVWMSWPLIGCSYARTMAPIV